MKKTLIFSLLIGCLLSFSSCEKDSESSILTKTISSNADEYFISTKPLAIAFASKLINDIGFLSELNSAIDTVCSYQLGEDVFVYDILNTNNSVFFHNDRSFPNLKSTLLDCVRTIEEMGYRSSDHYGNLNIIWHYHDMWNGATTPIICYITPNTTNMKGFRVEGNELVEQTVPMSAIDDESGNYIIIGYGLNNYDDLPMFKNGIRRKNNIIWPWTISSMLEDIVDDRVNTCWNSDDSLYTATVSYFKSDGNTRNVITGQIQYEIHCGSFLPDSTAQIRTYPCTYTRKEARNQEIKWFQNSIFLVPDWKNEFEDMALMVTQKRFLAYADTDRVSIHLKTPDILDTIMGSIAYDLVLNFDKKYYTLYPMTTIPRIVAIDRFIHFQNILYCEGCQLCYDISHHTRPY